MKRTELLDKLNIVAPALAANDIVPVQAHIWFTGETLMAYNGHIAISTPCKTEFACAVPGMYLLNLLKASGAKTIEFEGSPHEEGDMLQVLGASMKIKLPALPASAFNFKMPKPPEDVLSIDGEKFVAAIDTCLRSVASETTTPDYAGITLLPQDDGLNVFGANGLTLSRAIVKYKGDGWARSILPPAFCKQLTVLAKDQKKIKFRLGKERAMFADDKGTIMYGQLIDTEKPLPMINVFESHLKPGAALVPIPSKLVAVLERACIVSAGETTPIRTKIEVKERVARFKTSSRFGEVRDRMDVSGGQPDVVLEIDPKPVRAGCGDFNKMLITKSCFVMANETAYYMISGRDN